MLFYMADFQITSDRNFTIDEANILNMHKQTEALLQAANKATGIPNAVKNARVQQLKDRLDKYVAEFNRIYKATSDKIEAKVHERLNNLDESDPEVVTDIKTVYEAVMNEIAPTAVSFAEEKVEQGWFGDYLRKANKEELAKHAAISTANTYAAEITLEQVNAPIKAAGSKKEAEQKQGNIAAAVEGLYSETQKAAQNPKDIFDQTPEQGSLNKQRTETVAVLGKNLSDEQKNAVAQRANEILSAWGFSSAEIDNMFRAKDGKDGQFAVDDAHAADIRKGIREKLVTGIGNPPAAAKQHLQKMEEVFGPPKDDPRAYPLYHALASAIPVEERERIPKIINSIRQVAASQVADVMFANINGADQETQIVKALLASSPNEHKNDATKDLINLINSYDPERTAPAKLEANITKKSQKIKDNRQTDLSRQASEAVLDANKDIDVNGRQYEILCQEWIYENASKKDLEDLEIVHPSGLEKPETVTLKDIINNAINLGSTSYMASLTTINMDKETGAAAVLDPSVQHQYQIDPTLWQRDLTLGRQRIADSRAAAAKTSPGADKVTNSDRWTQALKAGSKMAANFFYGTSFNFSQNYIDNVASSFAPSVHTPEPETAAKTEAEAAQAEAAETKSDAESFAALIRDLAGQSGIQQKPTKKTIVNAEMPPDINKLLKRVFKAGAKHGRGTAAGTAIDNEVMDTLVNTLENINQQLEQMSQQHQGQAHQHRDDSQNIMDAREDLYENL